MKKIWKTVMCIVIVLIAFTAAFYGYKQIFIQETFYPSSSCNLISSPILDTTGYTNIISNKDIFTCKYDECIVNGSMTLDPVDIQYAAFHFCPDDNSNYEFCTGSVLEDPYTNVVRGTGTWYTPNYKIFQNDSITFLPAYTEGNVLITDKWFYVQEYICSEDADFINIISSDEYAIGSEIDDVEIQLLPGFGDISGISIEVSLINGQSTSEVLGKKVTVVTNNQGLARIDCSDIGLNCFNYQVSALVPIIIIRAKVNPTGDAKIEEKTVNILKEMTMVLNCPIIANINRDIECSWIVKDSLTNTVTSGIPSVEVFQSGNPLIFDIIGTTKLNFETSIVGSVDVYVTMSKDGYVSIEDYVLVNVQDLEITHSLSVDNRNILVLNTVEIGNRALTIVADDSGERIVISAVTANMETPTGQKVPLIFTKQATGWTANYDFISAGQTYHLTGDITFADVNRDTIPFSYDIVTSSPVGEKHRSTITYIIIGISVGIIAIAGALVYLFSRKKNRKKKKDK